MVERRTVIGAAAVLAALVACAAPAGAQPAPPLRDWTSRHLIGLSMSLEPHWTVSLRYGYRLSTAGSGPEVRIGGGVQIPPLIAGRGIGKAFVGSSVVWGGDRWGAVVDVDAFVARTENRGGSMEGFGVELRAAPGAHRARWSAALDVGWQGTLLTRIRHSEATREAFEDRYPSGEGEYEQPFDGWYRSTAHRFRAGVTVTRTLADGTVLQLAVGSIFNIQDDGIRLSFDLAQVPAYLEAAVQLPR